MLLKARLPLLIPLVMWYLMCMGKLWKTPTYMCHCLLVFSVFFAVRQLCTQERACCACCQVRRWHGILSCNITLSQWRLNLSLVICLIGHMALGCLGTWCNAWCVSVFSVNSVWFAFGLLHCSAYVWQIHYFKYNTVHVLVVRVIFVWVMSAV